MSPTLLTLLTNVLILGSLSAVSSSPTTKDPVPLDAPVMGVQAVEELGDELTTVAADHDMTAHELRTELTVDDSLGVDTEGRLFYLEAPRSGKVSAQVAAAQLFPASRTFNLASNPAASKTIYLNFRGFRPRDTIWNRVHGMPSTFQPAFNLDGNAKSFSASEHRAIQNIWSQVAEDYAPFDVNVTTKQPLQSDLTRINAADQRYGVMVVITAGGSAAKTACGRPCAGISYLDIFDDTRTHEYFQPVWVFTNYTGGTISYIAETISHEVGHSLSLLHKGTKRSHGGNEYHHGHGMWSPIMGSARNPLSQWSRGSYPGASNKDDEIAAIVAAGLPLRNDDHPGTVATAKRARQGVIERPSDVDVLDLGTCSGTIRVDAVPGSAAGNLDIRLDLLNASGQQIASANSPNRVAKNAAGENMITGLNAWIERRISRGRYYARVRGLGAGSWSRKGYDSYGSLGTYQIISSCDRPAQRPALGAPSKTSVKAGKRSATVSWQAPVTGKNQAITHWQIAVGSRSKKVAAHARSTTVKAPKKGKARVTVRAAVGPHLGPARKSSVTVKKIPGRVPIRRATSGVAGGRISAVASWSKAAPRGSTIRWYQVRAERIKKGKVVQRVQSKRLVPRARQHSMTLRVKGQWRFRVRAGSAAGVGAWSKPSNRVRAR